MLTEEEKELRYDFERLKTQRERYELVKRYNYEQTEKHDYIVTPILPPLRGRLPFWNK